MVIDNEEQLVRNAKMGEAGAFDSLIESCAAELRRAIDANLSEQWRVLFSSEDALQEALIDAFRYFDRFEWKGPGSFYGWLKRLALNGMTDEVRKLLTAKRHSPTMVGRSATDSMTALVQELCDESQASPSRIAMRDETVGLFRAALGRLPKDQQRAVELYDLEGREIQEVSRIMQEEFEREFGRTRKFAVHVLRFRAIARLRDVLADQESVVRRL